MVLAVEVAKLSQTDQLDPFRSEISALPPNQSIFMILNKYNRQMEQEALNSLLYTPDHHHDKLLLGWCIKSLTEEDACLPHIGGCTFVDVKFLLGRLWSARKEFLHAAKWAAIFPGWCGFLYLLQDFLAQQLINENEES